MVMPRLLLRKASQGLPPPRICFQGGCICRKIGRTQSVLLLCIPGPKQPMRGLGIFSSCARGGASNCRGLLFRVADLQAAFPNRCSGSENGGPLRMRSYWHSGIIKDLPFSCPIELLAKRSMPTARRGAQELQSRPRSLSKTAKVGRGPVCSNEPLCIDPIFGTPGCHEGFGRGQ